MPAEELDLAPGELNVIGVVGNDVILQLDFDISLTGYTFFAYLEISTAPFLNRRPFVISSVDLSLGTLNVFLGSTDTTEIGPISNKFWCFGWTTPGGIVRTILHGKMTLNKYP